MLSLAADAGAGSKIGRSHILGSGPIRWHHPGGSAEISCAYLRCQLPREYLMLATHVGDQSVVLSKDVMMSCDFVHVCWLGHAPWLTEVCRCLKPSGHCC